MTDERNSTLDNKLVQLHKRQRKPQKTKEAQDTQTEVIELPNVEPRNYDTGLVEKFLDVVFHSGMLSEEEAILTWSVKIGAHPAYPRQDSVLLNALPRTKTPFALYYGTATATPHTDGRYYNRKDLFSSLHVIVLDDIGTKIPVDKLPPAATPTYIIESSSGNFQYGYVLETPIDSYDAASTLIQLVYDAGYSDAGGKMPNKLVRLPEGVNGKPGEKCGFITKLHSMDGPLWEPQALLDALEIEVLWKDILENHREVLKTQARYSVGTSPWSGANNYSLDGVVDTVFEWLNEEGMVINDNGEWVTIECPWASEHNAGGSSTAGYLPLGRGSSPNQRGFHCFHAHCAANHTREFLTHVATSGGPSAPVIDPVAKLVSEWVFNAENSSVWKIKGTPTPIKIPVAAFKETHAKTISFPSTKGRMVTATESTLWTKHPGRITAFGAVFDPTTRARLVEANNHTYLNLFNPPDWKRVHNPEKTHHVGRFTQFLQYLIPQPDDNKYVIDWLAAKAQNMGFRGAALVMVAPKHGTGRTTFTDMIEMLFGESNVAKESFKDIIGATPFNEWQASPLVITNETKTTTGIKTFFSGYEKLKEIVDPRPQKVVINNKYGAKTNTISYSSFIFMSNHTNALAIQKQDRRFYVLDNVLTPATPEYFASLNEWIHKEAWQPAIWSWLNERKVDLTYLNSPPPMTKAKTTMVNASNSVFEKFIDIAFENWPSPIILWVDFERISSHFHTRLNLAMTPHGGKVIKRLFEEATTCYSRNTKISIPRVGKVLRPRAILNRLGEIPSHAKPDNDSTENRPFLKRQLLTEFDDDKLIAEINASLDLEEV